MLLKISASKLLTSSKLGRKNSNLSLHQSLKTELIWKKSSTLEETRLNLEKDHIYAQQMIENISYFFDDMFKIEDEIPAEASMIRLLLSANILQATITLMIRKPGLQIRSIAERVGIRCQT